MLQCIGSRTKLNTNEVPIDEKAIKEVESEYTNGKDLVKDYNPDTWIAGSVQLPTNKMVLLIELHGDSIPVICTEVEAPGIFVSEILEEVSKAFGAFKVTFPFFHAPDGQLHFGQNAYVQYTTSKLARMMKGSTVSKLPGGNTPGGGKYN